MSLGDASDFWSHRKAAVRAEAKADAAEKARRAERATAARLRDAQAGKTDAEILQELGLPDPDSLRAGDDFTAFLARSVPEHLRRRALRQLWGSNPVLANIDGLVDYDEDFTAGSVAAGALKTVYQVGRGAVARLDEATADAPEADALAEDTPAAMAAADTPQPDGPQPDAANAAVLTDGTGAPAPQTAMNQTATAQTATDHEAGPPAPPRPRHMQFTFNNEAAT